MLVLILGLVLFLGIHSLRIFAGDWRKRQMAALGEGRYKGIYSVVSVLAFVVLVYGFGQARQAPVILWTAPAWMPHLTALLVAVAFVLFAAAYVPGNLIKSKLGHPMLAGVKAWAFAHLIANGRLADLILFGAFMIWAIVQFIVCRRRDRREGVVYPPGNAARTIITVVVGLVAFAVFAMFLHGPLIGVNPFVIGNPS